FAIVSPQPSEPEPVVLLEDGSWPVKPLSEARTNARLIPEADNPWRGPEQSYFRDLALVAERQERVQRALNSQMQGGPADVVRRGLGRAQPPAEAATGGVEGAIERLTRAGRSVENRLKGIASIEERDAWKAAHGLEQRAMTTGSGSGIGFVPANG